MNTRQKIRLLYQVRYVVECSGSDEALKRVDYDIDMLMHRLNWNEPI